MNKLLSAFAKPSAESRPWAMWIWNLLVTRDEVVRQMQGFIEKGFAGVAIKPASDLHPPFLSDEFFALFGTALQEAEKGGLGVRLVSDFSAPWETGMSAALLGDCEYRAKRLSLEHAEIVPAKKHYTSVVDDPNNAIILAVKMKDGVATLAETRTLKVPSGEPVLSWSAPAGSDWKVLILRKQLDHESAGQMNVNMYSARAAHAYVQTVLDPFKMRFSRYMPKVFKGIVTEMPAILPSDGSIPWDDDLIVKFRARHRRELLKLLPAVFSDVEMSSYRSRGHIYEFLLQSMYERFAVVVEGWAKKLHLSHWTLCPERSPWAAGGVLKDFCGIPEANLEAVGGQNVDGIDENALMVRAIADMNVNEFRRATVTVLGRNRQSTAGSLQSLKKEIDKALQAGPSHLLMDGFFFNLDQRNYLKSPFGPSWYSPDWSRLGPLCDYAAYMQEAVHGTHFSRPVAVLFPSMSVAAEYTPVNDESVRKAGAVMRALTKHLQEQGIEFDLVSENVLLSCAVKQDGEFGVNDRGRRCNYRALVAPYGNLISKSLLVFVDKLASKGGTVVFINDAPQGSFDEGIVRPFTERVEKLLASRKEAVRVLPVEKLDSVLGKQQSPALLTVNGRKCSDLRAVQGVREGVDTYLLQNTSDVHDYFATLEIPHRKHTYWLDCENGQIHEVTLAEHRDDKTVLALSFCPNQSYVLAASDIKIAPPKPAKEKKVAPIGVGTAGRNYRIVLKEQWNFAPGSLNVLPLSTWNTRIGLSRESGGYSHFYESSFIAKELPKHCLLVLNGFLPLSRESGGLDKSLDVSVNGNRQDVRPFVPAPKPADGQVPDAPDPFASVGYLRNSLVCKLHNALVRGPNRVTVRTIGYVSHPLSLVYPICLVGNFSISKDARGWVLDATPQTFGYESWTRHGFPYLTGDGLYKHIFELPSAYERLILRFSQVTGSVDVAINGNEVGRFSWHPMEIDITKACDAKRNELQVRVTNTIDNYIRLNGRASGLIGEVYLDVY